jgi:hypothetical protein
MAMARIAPRQSPSGEFRQQTNVGARIERNAAQAVAVGVPALIEFNTIAFNDGMTIALSTGAGVAGTITVITAGRYLLGTALNWNNVLAANTAIQAAGPPVVPLAQTEFTTSNSGIAFTLVELAAGVTLQVQAAHGEVAPENVNVSAFWAQLMFEEET